MNAKKAIEEYQCPGCVNGPYEECYQKDGLGIGCGKHCPGTRIMPFIGKIFLGLPNGFNRLGPDEQLKMYIYGSFAAFEYNWGPFDKFNVPCWKYKDEHGNVIVRGYQPKRNQGFIIVFLCNCLDKIYCIEITKEDIAEMD